MPVIPIINRDTAELKMLLYEKIQQEHIQRRLVMLIVCIALLLDNMLYMVIVPIIPKYLRDIEAWGAPIGNVTGPDGLPDPVYEGESRYNGYLFASKAFVQLMANPFSGYIIDRHGYEKPMMFGLIIMFFSTTIFAFGTAYGVLFFARSLQGVGSAFADTAGLAMIADRFSDEAERSKMLGIALAFISFGSLVAPPFGGVMYQHMGKESPFIILSLVCLADAIGLSLIMKPKENIALKTALQRQKTMDVPREFIGDVPSDVKPTPMWKLFLDPYIAICAGALMMANVSLAFLEPTISLWINESMEGVSSAQEGMIWLPAFLPHVAGVWLTVRLLATRPKYGWLYAAVGLGLEGIFSFFIPACGSFWVLIIPLCVICFGIALIDTALLPALGYLVDVRHVSVYGSVYAIADISYSTAYAFGPVFAGNVYEALGFTVLCCMIGVSNLLYVPVLYWLRGAYNYDAIYNEGQAIMPQDKDGKMAQLSEWQEEQQRFTMSQTGPKNIMRNGAYGSMNRYHREYEKDTDRILPDNDEEDEME
ncbi:vesicular acetylcholine transporter-like [Paramacrobiotus metropolitanus]|uniref:vesicular acetylcholine transporter-like n=1 Tax=Paramacrobiotus metropolitanus TaxID=2943436 RepID=UPI002445C045|nr:vesicular acetylcholine transporter-like [Paramacrobiotus metropolitanus]